MSLYLVRHGETVWNVEQRRQGRQDSPLTQRGREQAQAAAEALARELADPSGAELVTSPTGRALTTARIIGARLGLEPRCDERLAEHDLGEWTGRTTPEVEAGYPGALARREASKWDFRIPGGESYALVYQRARAWLGAPRAKTCVVVSHEMFLRTLRGAALGLAPEEMLALRHGHGEVVRVDACSTSSRFPGDA